MLLIHYTCFELVSLKCSCK